MGDRDDLSGSLFARIPPLGENLQRIFLTEGRQHETLQKRAFTDHVKGVLSSEFALTVPDDVIAALSTMRCKVNRMKHESGVQDEEFISAAEYEAAVATIEQFWEFLEENEHVSNSNDAP